MREYIAVTHGSYTKLVSARQTVKANCPHCGQKMPVLSGAYFRKLRMDAGITLRGLSAKLGISPAYASDMELGRRRFLPKYVAVYERLGQKVLAEGDERR